MKKIWLIVSIILVLILGFIYFKKTGVGLKENPITTYKNSAIGISFIYPKILNVSGNNSSVLIHHEVPSIDHIDFCDFQGDKPRQNSFVDFNVEIKVVNKGLVDTIKSLSPYIPSENFVNGKIVASPGFIDQFKIGNFSGFSIFEGAEGCGHTIYYAEVNSNKTLVVTRDLITVLSGAITKEMEDKAMNTPGIINKEKEQEIFQSIFKTIKVD